MRAQLLILANQAIVAVCNPISSAIFNHFPGQQTPSCTHFCDAADQAFYQAEHRKCSQELARARGADDPFLGQCLLCRDLHADGKIVGHNFGLHRSRRLPCCRGIYRRTGFSQVEKG
ncbi:hypothetical protein PF008_g12203 [Phytophthora fragariae]|uniref:Uncharacterized protein n=1 Tax=Phytophthora fragariae TaxID=53985 RepID=A0A6G0RPZ5_9STRA|nr:hypothetical protein PF008_g12203 [Phytophthora fragariae]